MIIAALKDMLKDGLRPSLASKHETILWQHSSDAASYGSTCDEHSGRRHSLNQKVPDSVKLEISCKKRVHDKEKGIATDVGSSKSRKKIIPKRKRKNYASEVLDEALRKMRLKRWDLQLELIRGFLGRQVEKLKRRRIS